MEGALLEEERQKRSGTMQRAAATMPVERANRGEPARLNLATARHLLGEQGYTLVERFGHVHTTRDAQEWHLCLLTDLASMPPAGLLTCLDAVLTLRVEQSLVLSPPASETGSNARRDGPKLFSKQDIL